MSNQLLSRKAHGFPIEQVRTDLVRELINDSEVAVASSMPEIQEGVVGGSIQELGPETFEGLKELQRLGVAGRGIRHLN